MNLFMPVRGGMHKPASSASWTPADLSDLYMWFDASDSSTITKDGSNYVTQWNDKKNGYNLSTTGTSGPLYVSNGINSKGAMNFNADGSKLAWTSNTAGLDFARAQDGVSVIMVMVQKTRASSSGPGYYWFARNDSATYSRLRLSEYGSGRMYLTLRQQDSDGLYADASSSSYPIPTDTTLIHRLSLDYSSRYPKQYTSYHGDSQDIENANALPDGDSVSDTRSYAGGFGSTGSSNSSICYIGELLFVRDILTETEITNLNSYLKSKWGIS